LPLRAYRRFIVPAKIKSMEQIFVKIGAQNLNLRTLVSDQDHAAMMACYQTYRRDFDFLFIASDHLRNSQQAYDTSVAVITERNPVAVNAVENAVDIIGSAMKKITIRFIKGVENYLHDKYAINIPPYQDSHKMDYQLPFYSYLRIVSPIYQMHGQDLAAAGLLHAKKQVSNLLSVLAYRITVQRIVMEEAIFFSYVHHQRLSEDSADVIASLLTILAAFVTDKGRQLSDHRPQVALWKEQIVQTGQDYPLHNGFAIRFYKSGRVDLFCPTASEAAAILKLLTDSTSR
jgi:hypothetical protein